LPIPENPPYTVELDSDTLRVIKKKNTDAVQGTWTPKVRKPIRNIADLKIKSEA
jgi:hypothetical protein